MTDAEKIALLATKAMGWEVFPLDRAGYIDHEGPKLIQNVEGDWFPYGLRKAYQRASGTGWNPFESIADAWMLVEKSGGMWVCASENGHGWRAGILAKEDPSDEGGTYADTAPRAICEAFLKEIEATA